MGRSAKASVDDGFPAEPKDRQVVYTSISVKAVLQPAGLEKAAGLMCSAFVKAPTDPQWKHGAAIEEWRAMRFDGTEWVRFSELIGQ
jgi:hypothetical protein